MVPKQVSSCIIPVLRPVLLVLSILEVSDCLTIYSHLLKIIMDTFFCLQPKTVITTYSYFIFIIIITFTIRKEDFTDIIIIYYYFLMVWGGSITFSQISCLNWEQITVSKACCINLYSLSHLCPYLPFIHIYSHGLYDLQLNLG